MSENVRNRNNETNLIVICKVIILIVFVYPLLHYTVLNKTEDKEEGENKTELPATTNETEEISIPLPKREKIVQPSCPSSYLKIILQDLCTELFVRHEQCTPEDVNNLEKHKLPKIPAKNATTGEPRGTIVGCVAAGLLLTSLGAAFVELYKAKSQTSVKNNKPMMSRKCSLADLTVLKHNRKELIRRDSIMEIPESGAALRTLGFRPPPLYRRCSFPIGPSEQHYGNAYQESRRTSVEARRLSIIIDSRKNSTVSIDSRKSSIDRRISFDNESSPERRHWTRLVHRH